ncbi:Transcriptional regulatory protein dcuR [Serratia plymuthica]|uniref:Transcriptional regulatory protein dcuR n=1 Tax=Serratia plymuthica TaxID=82996 RepID=A0A2X4UFY7_SERPL|nr:Transcriptional regulatory protein dcuR [Serratia plymuthica]
MINVLIIDDDPMVAELNKYYLSQVSGFHCQATVATLAQARALLADANVPVDLVLLDIYMQQENGWICCPACANWAKKPTSSSFLPPATWTRCSARCTTAWWII